MADYGASSPLFAPFKGAEPSDKAPEYAAGMVIGKLVACGVTPNYAEGILPADNVTVNYQRKYKDADITVETDDLELEKSLILFGASMDGNDLQYLKSSVAPLGGYGFYHTADRNGISYYIGHFFPKVRASRAAHTFNTTGDSITFGTSSIAMKAMFPNRGPIEIESEPFTDEEAAFAWVANKVNLGEYFVINVSVQGATSETKNTDFDGKAFVQKGGSFTINIEGFASVKSAWDNGVDKTTAITGGAGAYVLNNIQADHDITIVF